MDKRLSARVAAPILKRTPRPLRRLATRALGRLLIGRGWAVYPASDGRWTAVNRLSWSGWWMLEQGLRRQLRERRLGR